MAVSDGSQDGIEDAVEFVQHLPIPETQDAVALLFEPGVTGGIRRAADLETVLCTVHFDDETGLMANEVHDVAADGRLPAHVQAVEAVDRQRMPELAFSRCEVPAQAPCPVALPVAHADVLPRIPSPLVGEG